MAWEEQCVVLEKSHEGIVCLLSGRFLNVAQVSISAFPTSKVQIPDDMDHFQVPQPVEDIVIPLDVRQGEGQGLDLVEDGY